MRERIITITIYLFFGCLMFNVVKIGKLYSFIIIIFMKYIATLLLSIKISILQLFIMNPYVFATQTNSNQQRIYRPKERGSHAMNLDPNRFNELSSHATESRSDFGVQRIQRIC